MKPKLVKTNPDEAEVPRGYMWSRSRAGASTNEKIHQLLERHGIDVDADGDDLVRRLTGGDRQAFRTAVRYLWHG